MHFSFDITLIVAALLGAAGLLALIRGIWVLLRASTIKRHFKAETEAIASEEEVNTELPEVSVIVYAHNDAEHLLEWLPLMLQQDYAKYEVIVVDDGSTDNSKNLLSDMLIEHENLRMSFAPEGSRSLSRKKLAIMIGMKAARYDHVLLTNANCNVHNEQWLATMMRNFDEGIDVVLGYSHYAYDEDDNRGRRYRVYDNLTVSSQFLSSAIKGKPYRGVSDNLALRREVFFENAGFSKNMHLRWGEDDVWVSEIANGDNTRVAIAPDAQVTAHYDNTAQAYHELKLRRDFTSRRVSHRGAMIVQGIMSCVNYCRLGCIAAAVALDYENIFTIAVAAVILIASWIPEIVAMRRTATILEAPRLCLSVPYLALKRPIVNMLYRWRGHRVRNSNFTAVID